MKTIRWGMIGCGDVAEIKSGPGFYGSGTGCFAADFDEEYNEIVGVNGRIHFSTFAPVPVIVTRGSKIEELPVDDPPHVHQPMIQSIVNEMNGDDRASSTGASAVRRRG